MTTTQNIESRLVAAHQKERVYVPNEAVQRKMRKRNVNLGSLMGVSGVGKSHLIPFIIRLGGSEFSELANMSSRPARPSDPDNFRGDQSITELLDRIEVDDLVNYVVHLSGTIYASDINSFTTRNVLLPTLTQALPPLQRSGCFERIVPIGIVTDGATWENERLDDRINEFRLQEALTCTAWLRAHLGQYPIIENKTDEEETTAQQIVTIMRDPSHPRPLDNLERVNICLNELAAVATRHLQRLKNDPI